MNQFTSNEQTNSQESFESVRKNFQHRFEAVTSSTINPSTISTFYEDALRKLISLTDDVVRTYRASTDSTLQGKELEDEAMEYYGLASIHETLTIIGERISYLLELQDNLAKAVNLSSEVFVPPNSEDKYLVEGSGKGLEIKQLIPRLMTLGYVLEHDLGLSVSDTDEVTFVQGEITDKMMRKHPYIRVSINPLNRIVYLCDEEGNASFVFDKEKILEKVGKMELLDVMEKFRYKEMIAYDPTCGDILKYGTQWRNNMSSLLTEPFEISRDKTNESQEVDRGAISKSSDFGKMVLRKKDGWECASSLREKVVGSYETIKTYAESFKVDHVEWFENQKGGRNITEYYHPDLVSKILTHFPSKSSKSIVSVPVRKYGWESASSLSEKIIGGTDKITVYVKSFKDNHPEWFENQKNKMRIAEHYHPDLVSKILEHFPSIDSIPKRKDGWMSVKGLSLKLKTSKISLKNFVDKYRTTNPEWFELQKPKGGPSAEHIHPGLVELILMKFKGKEDFVVSKRVGWEDSSSLYDIFYEGKDYKGNRDSFKKIIKKYASQYRINHPEWFEIQKQTGIIETEHYHPELVSLLKKNLVIKGRRFSEIQS